MVSGIPIILLGFVLGMRHAVDPDHVIAVTVILNRHRGTRRAVLTGLFWGLGHTLTIVAVGGAMILFNLVLPLRVSLGLELSVGIMLIVLGVAKVRSVLQAGVHATLTQAHESQVVHAHAHVHGDYVHSHPHGHDLERHPHRPDQTPLASVDRALGGLVLYEHIRPFAVGVVHGLAGSAAVALLVLAVIRDVYWAMSYLLVFGAGTIAGMLVVTIAIAWGLGFAHERSARVSHRLSLAAGIVSVAFGLFMTYQICFTAGLLPVG